MWYRWKIAGSVVSTLVRLDMATPALATGSSFTMGLSNNNGNRAVLVFLPNRASVILHTQLLERHFQEGGGEPSAGHGSNENLPRSMGKWKSTLTFSLLVTMQR
jgi:hypothetical protein